MNMNKNVLEHMDKAAYIILLCIAAVAVLVSMVTGPRLRQRRHHCRCAPLAHAPRRRTEIQTINFPHSKSPAITEPIGFAGLSVYSLNNAELFQGAVNAVVVHIRCHIICSRLGFCTTVAHRNTEADIAQHVHVVRAVAEHENFIVSYSVMRRHCRNTDLLATVLMNNIVAIGNCVRILNMF